MERGMKMKGILAFMLIMILSASLVFAQGPQSGMDDEEFHGMGLLPVEKAHAGNYVSENGEELQIREEKGLRIKTDDIEAEALLNVTQTKSQIQNRTKLHAELSNGRVADIKIMPSTASETALARLRLRVCSEANNCTIQLKEVGQGNETRVAYEIQLERHSRILGIFAKKMRVQTEVDAENGEVIRERKPWWAFLATEPAETA